MATASVDGNEADCWKLEAYRCDVVKLCRQVPAYPV